MPISIIERYILRRMTAIFLVATLSTLAIAWTTQVLQRIDFVTSSGQSAAAFFKLATLILPAVIPEVLPFAIAIAVSQTLMTMNTDSELVVINAAGAPRKTTARPILVLATAVCALSFLFQNFVGPIATQRSKHLLAQASADLLTTVLTEGSFQRVDNNLYLMIGERRTDGKLGSVFVADSRNEGTDLDYYAKTALVVRNDNGSFLVMEDGEVHRKKPGEDVSVIDFASYAFDLSEFTAAPGGNVVIRPNNQTLDYLLNPDPDDPAIKAAPADYHTEIHRRFTTWLYPLAFALLGLGIAGDARSHREARVNPIVSTIGLALLIRWLGYFAYESAPSAPAFAAMMYLAPLGAAAIGLFVFLTGRSMELPVGLIESVADRLARVRERLEFLRIRLPGSRSGDRGAA